MSTRGPKRPPALTAEESRYLDGTLSPEDARRVEREIAADPRRSDALDAYRSAVALWRADARQSGTPPEAMADRVIGALGQREAGGAASIPTWYAVAAMLLISVGVLGTALTRNIRPQPVLPPAASIQNTIIESLVDERFISPDDFEEGR